MATIFFSALALLPVAFIALMAYLANLGALLAVYIFNWITSPAFINLSYTNPARNEVIKVGLGITKQFVNMGLVVVLIFIALAIALRLKEYASQKTLIRLIAVALLVNFAPVICGLIVDAANIIMNFFLAGIQEGVSGILGGLSQSFAVINTLWSFAPIQEKLSAIAMVVVYLILNITIQFTFGLLAFIFLVRYIAIWVLVILAPLAFVAWILPATKKFWDQWWKQFIQWSTIGIPLAFFVYLAMASFNKLVTVFKIKMTMPGVDDGVVGALDFVLPYYVVIVMIWLGIIIGLQASAMGASGVINFAKSKGKAGAKWAAKTIPAGTAAATVGAFRGFGKGVKEGEGLGRITGAAKGAFMGAASYEGREKGREYMGRALEKARLARPGAYEADRRKRWKIEEEVKRLDSLPTDRLHDIAQRSPIRPADRKGAIAAFEVLAKRGELGDKEKGLLPKMQSFGADTKQALKARPDWGSGVGKTAEDIKKQIEGTTPRDFTKNTQAEALSDADVIRSLGLQKTQYIGIHGSASQKRTLKQAMAPQATARTQLVKQARQLQQQALQLQQQGRPEWREIDREWREVVRTMDEIRTNPNFR